jgi:hypothetical protein
MLNKYAGVINYIILNCMLFVIQLSEPEFACFVSLIDSSEIVFKDVLGCCCMYHTAEQF